MSASSFAQQHSATGADAGRSGATGNYPPPPVGHAGLGTGTTGAHQGTTGTRDATTTTTTPMTSASEKPVNGSTLHDEKPHQPPRTQFASSTKQQDHTTVDMPPSERKAEADATARPTKMVVLKNHLIAMIGEFVGTTLFLLLALGGTQVANIPSTTVTGATDGTTQAPNTSSLLYISLSFGFSLAVNAWIFFRVSGGLFNPSISFAMALVGALPPLRAALLIFAQILGGITGAAIIQALLPDTLYVRTQLSGGISVAQGLFLEMFLTAVLMLAIFFLAVDKSKATFIAPIGIGLALFICEMVGVYYTGGSLNPARSFGPNVVLGEFATYHWIYWVGPGLGSALAAGFYKFLKVLRFEEANPGQDASKEESEESEVQQSSGSQNRQDAEPQGRRQSLAPSTQGTPQPSSSGFRPLSAGRPMSSRPSTKAGVLGLRAQGPGLGDLKSGAEDVDGVDHVWQLESGNHPDNRQLSMQISRLEQLLLRSHEYSRIPDNSTNV